MRSVPRFRFAAPLVWSFALGAAAALSCSASGDSGQFAQPAPPGSPDAAADKIISTDVIVESEDAAPWNIDGWTNEGGLVIAPPCDNADKDGDLDKDGWSVAQGDCNDCTPLMNPGAYDYPGGVDEDCNGIADDDAQPCDDALAEAADDPLDAARAMGLCRQAKAGATGKDKTWGVLSARYAYPDGTTASDVPKNFGTNCQGTGGEGKPPNPLSRGILGGFGTNLVPRQGAAMFALSSGVARSGYVGQSPSGAHMCTKSGTAPGFPTNSTAACPNQKVSDKTTAFDAVALEVKVRAPSNAKSFSFEFDFYTYEYPDYVCLNYNDFFVALLWAKGAAGKNVCFDAKGNPVSVNNGFLEVCPPGNHGGKDFPCALGTSQLDNTGFDGHGATGWLQTVHPIGSGEEFTLRFAIWDMEDDVYDSTVLLDNFRWDLNELPPLTQRPPK
jgi:hypothetical protein